MVPPPRVVGRMRQVYIIYVKQLDQCLALSTCLISINNNYYISKYLFLFPKMRTTLDEKKKSLSRIVVLPCRQGQHRKVRGWGWKGVTTTVECRGTFAEGVPSGRPGAIINRVWYHSHPGLHDTYQVGFSLLDKNYQPRYRHTANIFLPSRNCIYKTFPVI